MLWALVTYSGLPWAILQMGRSTNACDSSCPAWTAASHLRFQKQAFISRCNSAKSCLVRRSAAGP